MITGRGFGKILSMRHMWEMAKEKEFMSVSILLLLNFLIAIGFLIDGISKICKKIWKSILLIIVVFGIFGVIWSYNWYLNLPYAIGEALIKGNYFKL